MRPALFGSDIEQRAVESTRKNLMAAGFSDLVKLQRADLLKWMWLHAGEHRRVEGEVMVP